MSDMAIVKEKKRKMSDMAEERTAELPDDCWELILNQSGLQFHFDPISLISKQFLSVTSSFKRSLTISDPNIHAHCNIPNLFRRFNKLNRIIIRCSMSEQDFNHIMICIARSELDLQELNILWKQPKIGVEGFRELGSNLKNFKTLRCRRGVLKDSDLDVIASSIPQLEELYIRCESYENNWDCVLVTDDGIELLASRLENLRSIDIFMKCFLSDRSLITLSLNCKLLTKIAVSGCQITEHGIGFALRHCQNLKSLWILGIKVNQSVSSGNSALFTLENSISYANSLCELEIRSIVISDALLCSIAKARLPLKRLALWLCEGFTYSGLSLLLQECKCINELELGDVNFLTDQMMNDLSTFLHNVTHIKIWSCRGLTDLTFFILTRKCLFLLDLVLEIIGSRQEKKSVLEWEINCNIKTLELGFIYYLRDESIKLFGLVCPNLKHLNLISCSHITEEGIGEILKSCPDLTHLKVDCCKGKRILGTGSEVSELNLEVLQLSFTKVDDDGMTLIGTRCPRLLQLDLQSCWKVTEKGVKEVVEECRNLREINLWGCEKVSFDVVPWMISARLSLRKIVSPSEVSEEVQRNLYMQYGCMVYNIFRY